MTRAEAVAKTVTALNSDELELAASIASSFHGGAGSLYENESINIARFILDHDYTPDPSIDPEVLAPLRVVAAAMELWGDVQVTEVADFEGSWTYQHSPETVVQLLYTAGLEQHRLARLGEMGIRRIGIRSDHEDGLCPACKADLGQTFPISNVPFLPHADCTCEQPCRCRYSGHKL
jgi:hypothetical protein